LNDWQGLKAAYNKTKSISFDFAIAEKCKDTVMVRAAFDWIDIGNWEEYSKIENKNNNLVFNTDFNTCYVNSDIPVALAGVDDLIIVIRSGKNGEPAAALITKKGQTQKVRYVVEEINKINKTELL
jgi:mannose-1-phosphate guanylyltransferase/mannose-1-phosphate guanylyltransferase/mannose-6-phosphate isomerase